MYYSKNSSAQISIPHNYRGNAFRVQDQSGRTYSAQTSPDVQSDTQTVKEQENPIKISEKSAEKFPLGDLLSDISAQDILLLGLIFIIHQDNPNDPILLILLLLLLSK